jgi:transposase-like protein
VKPEATSPSPYKKVGRIVLDESQARVGGEWVWLWVALNPARRIVLEIYLSKNRNGLAATSFMKKLMRKYGEKVLFVTDGGKWYPLAAQNVGARLMKGGVRSLRGTLVFRTIKDRLKSVQLRLPQKHLGTGERPQLPQILAPTTTTRFAPTPP